MENLFKKTIVRLPFEVAQEQLKKELYKEGFELGGVTRFHQPSKASNGREVKEYNILAVHDPFLYNEMMRISPFEGIILPCLISVIEMYPGETAIVPYNPMESIASGIQSPSLQNLTLEASRRLDLAIRAVGRDQPVNPDLLTSRT